MRKENVQSPEKIDLKFAAHLVPNAISALGLILNEFNFANSTRRTEPNHYVQFLLRDHTKKDSERCMFIVKLILSAHDLNYYK